ncbi:molybdopterin oxidoreductase family protein [Robbsia sp. Bb-Pol-6]|uniref:Molybdopterin oxidoreductase family protein n=1 Tax=Robbsia betulipollinis TaxID=2981849 RepID=A0ABT3ZQX8_9BURK|nr:molybdopterin oxidoreductase family protein [Robbsia betulipollinis]MCY0388958.1 molybdopterin oxidoreductase family protein [Robbsia betulipollinis]
MSSPAITTIRGVCPHDCPDTCAMKVTVEDGRATAVRGDPDHPPTQGVLCTKVSRYTERTYHRDRLRQPMRRVGPKGEGRFEPISWDAALALAGERLGEIARRAPEAILPYSYAGTMGLLQTESIAARFFNLIGASRLDRTICASAGAAALKHTYGGNVGMQVDFIEESQLILIWGSNPVASSLHFWTRAQEAKRRGARLIAIDPYRSLTAEKCHEHIALRPGTDGALALGMIHLLIAQDMIDEDYVARHTLGFAALAERARQWPPARVAAVCGIPERQLRDLAHAYGTVKPASIRLNYGMQRAYGGGNAVRAVACLPSLVGAWRHRAGGMLLSTSGYAPVDTFALQRPDLHPGWPDRQSRIINMNAIGDALTHPGGRVDGQDFGPAVEAVIVYNSNPVAVAPDSRKVVAGFAREDLFTIVLEHFQTDTADYADLLLPATTQLEHFDVHKAYGHTYVMVNQPSIAPLGEARPNTEIFRGIARAMGLDHPLLQESDAMLGSQALRWSDPLMGGADWARLQRESWIRLALPDAPFAEGGFHTPSGKCEFASSTLAAEGRDPLPDYLPPRESAEADPALAARYPLAMISPPARNFLNSTFVNVDSLRKTEPEPHLDMHPDDAAARGIANGDPVRVFNDRGSLRARARVGDRARGGLVVGLSIWWRKLAPDGRNANELTSQALTDLGGSASFYDCLVEVEAWPAGRSASPAVKPHAPSIVGSEGTRRHI